MFGTTLIILCTVLWATDAIFRMPLVQAIDASSIILFEHALGVLITLPLFWRHRHEVKLLQAKGWLALGFIGVLGSAVGTYLFTASFRFINPTVAILLQKMQPVFAVISARLILREVPKSKFYLWAILALISSAMVSLPELWSLQEARALFPSLRGSQTDRALGICMAVGAAFFWGVSTVFGKWITARLSFQSTSFLRFAFGLIGVAFLTILATYDAKSPLTGLLVYLYASPQSLISLVYMAVVPGVLAMYLYYAGLKHIRASSATFAELFFPVASIVLNWTILGQTLGTVQIVGGLLLLGSVYFINRNT
jgi:drug/metabolite transporter (DMT)-like permease